VGKGFEAAQMVLLVLGVSCLIESSLLITTSLLGSTGHQKTQAVFAAVEGALGVVLSILMAQTMGLQGVVIGYSISVILIRGLICPWYVCRLLGIDVIKYYIDCLARPWLITGLLAILVHLSGLLAYTNSWVPLIVLTAVAACAFIALAWIIAMNQQEKSEVLGFIRMNILRLRLGKEIV
jgi:O-antigen/teichoic acid export membrane protein